MMLTKTGGRWLIVNPKHYDYQSSIVLTLVNVTNTTSQYGERIEREKLEKVYMFDYVDIGGIGEFFQSRLQCKIARVIFLSIQFSCKRNEILLEFSYNGILNVVEKKHGITRTSCKRVSHRVKRGKKGKLWKKTSHITSGRRDVPSRWMSAANEQASKSSDMKVK